VAIGIMMMMMVTIIIIIIIIIIIMDFTEGTSEAPVRTADFLPGDFKPRHPK
jgi:hypothetical protein